MRTLEFIVNNKSIIRDPDCDFSGLFPGTEKCIMAHFSFSEEIAAIPGEKDVEYATIFNVTATE